MYRHLTESKNLVALLESGRKQSYPKGHVLKSSETSSTITLIKKGFVKRYLINNEGSHGVQSIYGPGDIFPLTLVFQCLFQLNIYEGPETYYYEAMSPTITYSYDCSLLARSVEKDPSLHRALLLEAGKRLHSNIQQLENITLHTAYNRVAHQLAYFAKEYGVERSRGIKLGIPLTHLEIANTLSLTRETVSMAMIKLREDGLILTGKNIVVPDIDKLQAAAFEISS